jgi:endo-1,4-beta-xylanase
MLDYETQHISIHPGGVSNKPIRGDNVSAIGLLLLQNIHPLGVSMLFLHDSQRALLSLAVVLSVFVFDDFSDMATAQEDIVAAVVTPAPPAAFADLVLPVWPDEPPAWNAPSQPEFDTTTAKSNKIAGRRLMRLTNVSRPELHVFRPTIASTNTTVLIAPGGGYSILAWDLEGTEIATWLQSLGITAIVLKYRVPTRQESKNWLPAVQDLQRSISLIRSNGIPGVKTESTGVLGFSAGGNASARVATATARTYDAQDKIDESNCIPDFAVLIYPAWLVERGSTLIEDLKITPETPPMFLAHAANDSVTCLSSVGLFTALKQKDVPAELHVFTSGGHGFGGRTTGMPTDAWKSLCRTWIDRHDWHKP